MVAMHHEVIPEPATSELTSQLADLVDANQILFHQGILDAFGHVSVRADYDSEKFLLARNLAPALVGESDIQEFNLDGETADSRAVYLERFIHAEIYRARPEVMAVVHSHSPVVVPFSVVDVPLRPVMHMAGFLPQATPVFEIRETLGTGSDHLIRDARSGKALADVLGSNSVALMRGHGAVTVAGSLQAAVYQAVYTEINARTQADALRLGTCTYLTGEERKATAATMATQMGRAWNMWRTQARARNSSPAAG
jgi:HCOMODA/2-hydroxy-3-carboxy-muconic semialdehyde decarboxylase